MASTKGGGGSEGTTVLGPGLSKDSALLQIIISILFIRKMFQNQLLFEMGP